MSTCERVDLPEPLGPMSACTSPERTSRSTPRRISRPSTDARNPSIFSTLIAHPVLHPEIASLVCGHRTSTTQFRRTWGSWEGHDHGVAVDADGIHGHRLGGGEALRLAGEQRERGAVLPAL